MRQNLKLQRGSMLVWILVLASVLFLAGGFFWLYLRDKSPSSTPENVTTNQPQVKVTDYSQGVPPGQKTAVLVEHSDSSFEKFILPNTMVNNFVQHLSTGERVVSKTPITQ